MQEQINAIHPAMLEKMEEQDRQIQNLEAQLHTRNKQIESFVAYVDQKDSIINSLKVDIEERDREIERLSASMQYFDESGRATYKPEFGMSAFKRLEHCDLSDWKAEDKSFVSVMMKMAFHDGIDVGKAEVYRAIDGNQDL
jgi:predicted RNase H-like nuclease (RuvC/YqgF family)